MRDLLLFIDEVESWQYRIILVLVLAYVHEHFDHVLNTMAYVAFVYYSAEAFKDCRTGFWRVLLQEGNGFARETNGNFDRIVRSSLKEKNEDLMCN